MNIDQVALAPLYCAAATALLVFLTDLAAPGRRVPVLTVAAIGSAGTVVMAALVTAGPDRQTFCGPAGCSLSWDALAGLIGVTIAAATLVVVLLSAPALRSGSVPPGEYCFLLACSMTGGLALGAARDLITIIVALETLTLPLYVLVGLRRRSRASAEAAVTFFLVSVVSTTVSLLGAALLYGAAGTVHLGSLRMVLTERTELRSVPLVAVAAVLVLAGLAFKVAAVPFHAWAPATYDGAPLPVAAYLSTASKVGGVAALLLVAVDGLGPWLDVTGPVLAALAVATMTVGNLGALRQRRMVRLLAWSSVAQAGYILAPLGAFALAGARRPEVTEVVVTAVLGYTIFYVALELAAFGAVIALRRAGDGDGDGDGGELADYAGAARQRPWVAGAFVIALVGLAGLPPGFAGLFAKVAVVRSLLDGDAGWLAVVVAVNAVIGLAYYVRAAGALFGPAPPGAVRPRLAWPVAVALAAVTVAAAVIGLAPQLVLDAAGLAS